MNKKILFAVSLLAGLLMAGQALAATYAPGSAPQAPVLMQAPTAGISPQPLSTFNRVAAPCPMLQQNGSMAMENCGNYMYSNNTAFGPFRAGFGAWVGLMFILTVMMVWVVLLLLICVLWHHLQKHKH
ncbi:MAG TPA: hypothetical protein VE973_02460 [Candidatus Limnocylindria bacterium]|nr:hypothetical protein [Candidatus Limnocylindria bacterium]